VPSACGIIQVTANDLNTDLKKRVECGLPARCEVWTFRKAAVGVRQCG
jgi:hypothetical protein